MFNRDEIIEALSICKSVQIFVRINGYLFGIIYIANFFFIYLPRYYVNNNEWLVNLSVYHVINVNK